MKILHVTDFHFSSKYQEYDYKTIVTTLIENCKDDNIEYVFFTGDLVYTGESYEDFIKARELLFNEISIKLSVPKNNIFICCGNHDVHRGEELEDIKDIIYKIDDPETLEKFVKKQSGKSFLESQKNLKNYIDFEKEFYGSYATNPPIYSNPLVTIHKFKHGNIKVGLMSMNTAWRAIDSEKDRGNLLFPISLFKEALNELKKDTEFRILLHHHPISEFKGWNSSELEDLISVNFHIAFNGHLHKRKLSSQITTDGGILSCSSAATLALDGTLNGYGVVELDLITYDGNIEFRSFNRQEETIMVNKTPRSISIPSGHEKQKAIDLIKTIRKKYNEELDRADELFILHQDKGNECGFTRLFTDPILKAKSSSEVSKANAIEPNITLEEVIKSEHSYLIYGKDKTGKTCILYKLLLTYLSNYSSTKTLPLYIDSNDFKRSSKPIDFDKIFIKYYEINSNRAKELYKENIIVLLIDNYDPKVDHIRSALSEFQAKNPLLKVIAISEEKIGATYKVGDLGDLKHQTIYIHEILRSDVRSLANKWPNLTDEKKETILEKIFKIFRQLNLPANYWTVSLFISIFERNSDANFHNNFELIQLYIDNLLDRKQLALDKSIKIDFEEFKSYLSSLSYFLLNDRAVCGYTATYSEIVTFTSNYRDKNRRFVISTEEIIKLILDKGIIRKTADDSYTFRLNGVFEYFLASYMSIDEGFKIKIIEDDHFYLSFKNELELYAGFSKTDKEFLEQVYKKTQQIFKIVDKEYESINIDMQLAEKVGASTYLDHSLSSLGKTVQQSLSFEQQDAVIEEMMPTASSTSEVKVKNYYETIESTTDNLEKAILILSRVYRNLKIQNDRSTDEILDYILERVCFLGLKLMDDAKNDPDSIIEGQHSEDKAKIVLKLISTLMPLLVQSFLFDAIAQNDLERIFKEKITQLKKNSKHNQFRLFVLYLIVIDIDLNHNKDLLEELCEVLNMPILKRALLLKLHYYIMFKCNENNTLIKFIQRLIQQLSVDLNEKTDLSKVQQAIEKSKKIASYNNKTRKDN